MLSSVSVVLLMLLAAPAGGPATSPGDLIRVWFEQLADADADVREQARVNLMGIDRRQLPELRQIVSDHKPIRASQAAVLQDIVKHVYKAGMTYDVRERVGFLGVTFKQSIEPPGAMVERRVEGFCAYRFLRDGDVIVGIAEMPAVRLDDSDQLRLLLQQVPAGTRLTFQLIRNGRTVSVPIRLDARPAIADRSAVASMDEFESMREEKAQEYWSANFAPVLEGQGLTAASP